MVMTGKCAVLAMVGAGTDGLWQRGQGARWPLRRLVLRCLSMRPAACAKC